MVVLAMKTYALKSNYTRQMLLKGKGIPEWMVGNIKSDEKMKKNIERCIWNGNGR